MRHLSPAQPIGIFDSGIGGLTVAQAVVQALPHEHIVYFGDTAHLPYGEKSAAAIQAYAIKIIQMLLEQKCKLILIACNSATAAAYELIKEYVGTKTLLVNVIDPVIHYLQKHYAHKRVGLIGTRQTVNSNIYKRKIDVFNVGIDLIAHATNLLASAIEEFGDHDVIDGLLQVYLAEPRLHAIDALMLACTHYPVIKNRITRYYQQSGQQHVAIIDSSEIIAASVKKALIDAALLNNDAHSQKHFYVSDYTESFKQNARLFFDEELDLQSYPLWD